MKHKIDFSNSGSGVGGDDSGKYRMRVLNSKTYGVKDVSWSAAAAKVPQVWMKRFIFITISWKRGRGGHKQKLNMKQTAQSETNNGRFENGETNTSSAISPLSHLERAYDDDKIDAMAPSSSRGLHFEECYHADRLIWKQRQARQMDGWVDWVRDTVW